MENIVEVSQLTKRYRSFAALNDCSLSITQGTVFGLLGPNGAGKTTMIRCLMGYLKPTSGTVTVDGLNCHSQSLQVRQRVSYLPAESKLFRLMKGSDCIDFFASIHPRGNKTLAFAIARRLELDTTRRVAFMSTGMRQKLAISCVMSCQSRLMILDEPTANLDPTVRSEVLQLVREANERGTTIAFCSHVLDEIEQICDKAAILKQGKVVVTIDLRELKFVHRIQGAIPQNGPLKLRDDHVRTIEQDEARIVMEIDGPLDNHLEWLSN
ncbi:MAG: ABC transporter ATP-binding protein, partial [Pirellula staleyi]